MKGALLGGSLTTGRQSGLFLPPTKEEKRDFAAKLKIRSGF